MDEAHCISHWDHDFRPDYLQLGPVIEALGHPPVLALTATASPPAREEIVAQLRMRDPAVVVTGFQRPNIRLQVGGLTERDDARAALADSLGRLTGTGIVYVATRREADRLATALGSVERPAVAYHAGLPTRRRDQVHERFLDRDHVVVVATTAFGMGIDAPHVRFVLHADAPESIDTYYQELGRAGRDGAPADAVVFHARRNGGTRPFQAGSADPTRAAMMTRYLDTRECRWRTILAYFGQLGDRRCGRCDNCVQRRRGRSRDGSTRRDDRRPFPVDSLADHKAWGSGRVLGYDGDTMTLLFDEAGYRTLSVRVVQDKDLLQPSGRDDPA